MDRLWNKVEIGEEDECWPWTGARLPGGRGQFVFQGKARIVTQVILELEGFPRPKPPYDNALHKPTCKPSCCNPQHLRWGSQRENMQDMVEAGNSAGAATLRAYHSKLSDDDVRTIRNSKESPTRLGEKYNITYGSIWRIQARRTFQNVTD